MSWNYRVMKRKHKLPSGGTEDEFGIYEVYYNNKGKVDGWTEDSVAPHGETLEELKKAFDLYKGALDKPALDYKTGKEE